MGLFGKSGFLGCDAEILFFIIIFLLLFWGRGCGTSLVSDVKC